jgi:hypothetical protein
MSDTIGGLTILVIALLCVAMLFRDLGRWR